MWPGHHLSIIYPMCCCLCLLPWDLIAPSRCKGEDTIPGGVGVSATINPSRLNGLDIIKEQGSVRGVSHCSHLPAHVAQRQADSTMDTLKRAGYSYSIEVVTVIIHLQAAV